MQTILELAKILHDAHKLCFRQNGPLSCFVLIVQVRAIKNAVDEDGKFERIFGPGAAKVITDVIDCWFNMDGKKPHSRKVVLLDRYHVWCFLMDPFNYEWRITFIIDGKLIWDLAMEMIAHFVPKDGTKRIESFQRDLMSEFEVRLISTELVVD